MKTRLLRTLFFLVAFGGAGVLWGQQASLQQDRCSLIGETSQNGTLAGCVDAAGNPPAASDPFTWTLERLVGGNWTTVATQGTDFPKVDFANPGAGTYRVMVTAFIPSGTIIITNPKGGKENCVLLVSQTLVSPSIQATTEYDWYSFPLGYGANSGQYMDVRDNSNDGKVYYVSHDLMWNYYFSGGSWIKAPLSWSTDNVAGPISALPGSSSSVFYRGDDSKMHEFSYSGGSWSSSVLNNSVNNVAPGGQIAASSGKVYYRGTDNNIYNFYRPGGGPWVSGRLRTLFFGDNASGELVEIGEGHIVYRRGNGQLTSYRFLSGSGVWTRADIGGATGVAASPLASTGNLDVWFHTVQGEMRRASFASGMWVITTFIGTNNVAGDISASPDEPTHIYYRGTDDRVWQFYRKPNGVWTQVPLDYDTDNVKGPLANQAGKVFYRDFNNDIWNVYWSSCISKSDDTQASGPVAPSAFSLNVYPNPASDLAYIEIQTGEVVSIDLAIYNTMGKKVRDLAQQRELGAGTHELPVSVSELPTGVYLVHLRSGDQKQVHRLLVQ